MIRGSGRATRVSQQTRRKLRAGGHAQCALRVAPPRAPCLLRGTLRRSLKSGRSAFDSAPDHHSHQRERCDAQAKRLGLLTDLQTEALMVSAKTSPMPRSCS